MSDQEPRPPATHTVGGRRRYLDEICYLSRRYRGHAGPADSADLARLGRVVFHVRVTLADNHDPYRAPELTEGAATVLPVGTAVREVLGSVPECRLAAVWGDRLHVYDA